MKSNKYIVILFILTFFSVDVASAVNGVPFQRILLINEWGGQFSTKANIDKAINEAVYMNADAVGMQIGSEYFEAVRNSSRASWDSRASWNMLEYALDKAHSKNIQAYVWITVNNAGSAVRAERRMWGTKYNVVRANGNIDSVRLEIANPIVANYEADLIGFIAKHYPTLDGIQIEEPFYVTQSYSPEIVARVKAKFNGYNIIGKNDYANSLCGGSSMVGTDQIKCPTFAKIYDVERDAFNELFTKMSSYVNKNKSNPNLLFSANGPNGYRPLHGFDARYMSDQHLLDWYSGSNAMSLSGLKSGLDRAKHEIDDIPVIPVSDITSTTILPSSNPSFLAQIEHSCEYGGNAEMIFSHAWRYKIVDGGKTAYEGLHNLLPSSLCIQSTIAPAPTIVSAPTFSPTAGSYSTSRTISISTSTAGATIRYTIDGTTPVETSPIYSAPILISSTATLKARAWKTGYTPSTVTMATYSINTPVPVLSSITVSPPSVTMGINSAQTFTAYPKDQFGDPIATTLTWTSSDQSVGTITPSGLFTALAEGTTIITASSGSVTGKASAVITASQDNLNIINNPGFESGMTTWNFFTDGTGSFRVTSPGYEGNNAAILALNNIGSNTQLYQTGISLEPDTKYRLSFSAYSDTGDDLSVRLFKHYSPYASYMPEYKVNLGTSWQTFTTEFNTAGLTSAVNDGRLMFWFSPFATSGDIYHIDDVRLEKLISSNVPMIVIPPESQTVMVGEPATFSIIANGTETLSYQWQKNGVDIPGEIYASYTIPGTTLQDNGSTYRVIVTNPAGSVISEDATLFLTSLPNLITNPGFESEKTSWNFFTDGTGSFMAASPGYEGNNAAVLALNNIGSNVQLYQTRISLEPDTNYRLSFSAYSNTGNDLSVRLIQHYSPYASYMPEYKADLGKSWQTFIVEFNTTGLTNTITDGRLMFWLSPFAAAGDTYYIDDIRLENLDVIP